ncbi:MAG: hypothetical protein K8T91_24750 [Planctomycetes bacterium]|nr:hypothetical protein [Planctomycetota bacterium]
MKLARWISLGLVVIGACWLPRATLWGADPAGKHDAATTPLTFRRVFVPAEQVDQWPRGATRYVPVKAAELERLLSAATERSDDAGAPASGRLVAARYSARLTAEGLLSGEMQLDVRHDAQDPLHVPLTPCGVALSEPEWLGDLKSKPAVVGVDPEGVLRLVVAQRGTMRATWSLRGRREENGDWSFMLALPAVPSSRLSLELPRTLMPWIESGSVSELPGAPKEAKKETRIWQIELGARSSTRLLLVHAAEDQTLPQAVVRQNLVYDFSPRGLELTSRLTLDLGVRPLDHLDVELGAGLHLLDARMGDVALTWSRRPSRANLPEQVSLEFPEPLSGGSRVVHLRAVAPLRLGERLTLPTLSPRDVFWQDASVTLLVPRPLSLQELALTGCRQSKIEPLAGAAGQSLSLQCFTPDARIEVRVDRPEPLLSIASATSLELTPRETRGRWVADCEVTESECFGLSALVMPHWQIEQVESEPVGGLEHWTTAKRGGQTYLQVRFSRAVTPKRPLRISVSGRLAESALAGAIPHTTLQMLTVEGAARQQRWFGLSATKPHQLQVRGDEDLTRLDITKLDPLTVARFGSKSPELLYRADQGRDDHGAGRLQLSLVRQAAEHAADIHVTLHVRDGLLEESARIACRPDSGGLDRLLVHVTQVRSQPFQWSLVGDEAARLAPRRLTDVQQREAGYSSGETWEIVLDSTHTAPFSLLARRTLPLQGAAEATLMAVSPVSEQHGMITVRSEAGEPLQVDNLRLLPIPTESAAPERLNTACASYRYDPDRDAVLPQSMLLLTRPKPGTLSPGAVAWKASYEVRCNADGRAVHHVVMHLENRGRRQIRVDLPPGASLEQVTVDGVAVRRDGGESRQGALVELAAERRFLTIGLDYVSLGSEWGSWARLTPVLPTLDIDVLSWEGTAWTPPGYRILGNDLRGSDLGAADGSTSSWLSRLAGPLARRSGEPVFNPLRAADWQGLVGPAQTSGEQQQPIRQTVDAPLPWPSDTSGGQADRSWTGWTANRISLGGARAPVVVVIREPLWIAAGWSIFLLTAFGLWWLFPRSVRGWSLLLGSLALAALVAPALVAPALTIVFMGVATAALMTALVPGGPRWQTAIVEHPSSESWKPTSQGAIPSTLTQLAVDSQARVQKPSAAGSSVRRGLLLWLVGLLVSLPHVVLQADDPQPAQRKDAGVYTILVPIDKDRKPSGDTWYVPLEFYRALSERAAKRTPTRRDWLTTGVQYRGRMEWNVAQTRLQMSELKASYDVEVFGRQTQIRFSLGRDSVSLLPSGATLDGRTIEPVWDQRGQGLLIDVAEAGQHRIELMLKPLSPETDPAGIEISTAALPMASLDLSLPSSAPAIEIPTALGAVHVTSDPPRLTAQLGGANKLAVRWPQAQAQAEADVRVEQLLWLKIAPGSVTLDARIKPQGFEGRRQKIQVQVDPSLRFLSAKSSSAGAIEARVLPGVPQTIELESAHGFAADEEVSLALLWLDASGLGRLRLPRVTPINTGAVRSWLAVVVDKSLAFETPRSGELVVATPAELATQWPIGRVVPDLVYRLPRGDSSWSITTEPHAPQTTAEQTLALSLSANSAEFRYVALLETTAGSRFQYRLRVPKGVVVTRAELTQEPDGEDCVEHWSQLDGVLTIFLAQPVTGSQRLAVRGNWPLAESRVPAPQFQLEDCRQQSLDLAVYRRPGVDVQPVDAEAVHELSEPTTELLRLADRVPRWFGRPLGTYRLVNLQAATIFKIRPAPPHSEATQILTLSRKDGVWQATIDFRLHVRDGAVDTIRFLLPASLRGPLSISPEEPFTIVEVPGQRQRQLVIRPREAVRDRLRLTVSGSLVFASGQRVTAPLVEPIEVAQVAQYVVLPKQVEQERVEWELRGLERQELPHDGDSPPVATQSVSTYRVAGPRFQAALASVEKIERAPRIRLADVRLTLDDAGMGTGVVTFDLEPAGLGQCILVLPAGVRPIRVSVGSLPTALTPLEENHWEMNLISNQLPQRVEVLFQGAVAQQRGQLLSVPWIAARGGPMEVIQTLWTVYAPRGASLAAKPSTGTPASALGQQWQRLESISTMLGEASADESAEILARWFEPWAFDMHDTSRDIGRNRPVSAADAEALAARLHDHRRQQEQIAQRLHALDVLDRAVHAAVPAQPGTALWRWSRPEGNPTPLRLTAAGPLPELRIEKKSVVSSDLTTRLLLSALLCGAIGMLLWPRFSPQFAVWAWRGRYALAALAGLLAWFLLSPGLWGLMLAVLALVAAWRLGERKSGERGA